MGLNAFTEQLVGDQVCDFVSDRLSEEVFAVFPVQLRIEAQQILVQMRDTGFLASQFETDHRALEGTFEKGFCLLKASFNAVIELLGHASRLS